MRPVWIVPMLAACSIAGRAGLTTSTSASSSAPSAPAVVPSDGGGSSWDHKGILVRSQLEPLVGMTVEAARQRLAQLGHDGKVIITEEYQYVDRCGQDKVCSVEPESGTGVHDDIRLSINRKLEIAAPP
jgi:hypothetical protein